MTSTTYPKNGPAAMYLAQHRSTIETVETMMSTIMNAGSPDKGYKDVVPRYRAKDIGLYSDKSILGGERR